MLPYLSRLTHNAGKSKKYFKPKAPLRRPGAPGSSQSSVRGSVERQVPSQTQTPQPSGPRPNAVLQAVHHDAVITSSSANQHGTPIQSSARIPPKSTTVAESSHPEPTAEGVAAVSTALKPTSSTATAAPMAREVVHPQPQNLGSEDAVAISIPTTSTRTVKPVAQKALNPPSESLNSEDAVVISIPTTRRSVRRPSTAPTILPTASNTAASDTAEEVYNTSRSSERIAANSPKTSRAEDESSSRPATKRRKAYPLKKAATPCQPAVAQQRTTSDQATAPAAESVEGDQEPVNMANTTEDGIAVQSTKPKKKKQQAKPRSKKILEAIAAAIVVDATEGGEALAASGTKRKKKAPGKRKRAQTPEDAETVQIEPGAVKMADLCKDTRTGKKSKRETALQARDAEELLKKQQQQIAENNGTPAPAVADESAEPSQPAVVPSETSASVPGVRIVNGQLVLDESTRTIDRVAIANEARGGNEEVVVVDSLSHKVNSGTYGKRGRKEKWGEEMTDRFYDGLRMFGTDFGMISKMFPGRSRRTIKLKFNHEERLDNEKIKITLSERIPVDMEAFSEMSKTTYREKAEVEREMAEDRKRLEEEQANEKEERDRVAAERVAEAAAEAAADHGGNLSAKENEIQGGAKGKKGDRRRKAGGTKSQMTLPTLKPKPSKVTKASGKVLAPVR